MKTNMIFAFVAVLIAATLASCSDDDQGIYFTQQELIGDIATGKQLVVNSLEVYRDHQSGCTVCGGYGTMKAVSSDEKVATAQIQQSGGETYLTVTGTGNGKATITVADQSGNSASLTVSVTSLPLTTYVRVESEVVVTGVEDSVAQVIKEVVSKGFSQEYRFELEEMPTNTGTVASYLYAYDASGQWLYTLHGTRLTTDGTYGFVIAGSTADYPCRLFADTLVFDLTDGFKKKFPAASVQLIMRLQ